MARLTLVSPLRGWAMPLEEVPDPVFAGRLMGEGAAIDPVGSSLHAPCDATIVSVHAARHAVSLRADNGAEILLHLGIDTVALDGEGFVAHVAAGQAVRAGERLISFDLDRLLATAPSMATPMLLTDPDAFAVVERHVARGVEVGDPLLVVEPRSPVAAASVDTGTTAERLVTVSLPHGLHARPAARIAALARGFDAALTIGKAGTDAPATSVTAMLALDVRAGNTVRIAAQGGDAVAAVAAVAELIDSGMEEGVVAPAPTPPVPTSPDDGLLRGVMAAPGIAIGTARWLASEDRVVAEDGAGVAIERRRLDDAIAAVRRRLAGQTAAASAAVLAAHRELLDDPALHDAAAADIVAGRSAGLAWRRALRAQAARLRDTGNPRMAERADDLLDIERQVLAALDGEAPAARQEFAPGTILLADDLLPSDVAALEGGAVVGLCSVRGGPTSHVAILAAGLGLPAIVAMGEALHRVADGTPLILDATAGLITPDPDTASLAAATDRRDAARIRRDALRAASAAPAATADGTRIAVMANLATVEDAAAAVANGAEGCGLLRTEFLFLDRAAPPDEAEQAAGYRAIAGALGERPLIVRLLDIGGDKPVPWLAQAAEDNPALGLRGIRVGLARPDLLDTQLRAILSAGATCRIMVPMIASVAEIVAVRARVDHLRAALGIAHPVEVGIMVETPAAAVTADLLARHADFLSIGSNDLTQYALAMDRGNPAVAAQVDGLHPAVLRLIDATCRGAAGQGRWTGVCGGLASDPLAVPILVGLGVTELSATPARVPEIKAAVHAATLEAYRALARDALAQETAEDVRRLARAFASQGEARA
ncbi:phosphoenolpyruvate--protein phosphotransferase [Sphingomonas adhaesiva]|uniref:phosphoenolpyruvate--protein phosphotransferase n=1 Tax=Sphingomonas adhaesiva TaxID=28212 RepID=UPI002FFA43FD